MIDLVSFVDGLRTQLEDARSNALAARKAGSPVAMSINKITIELSVTAAQEGGAGGKIKFAVLGIGAELGADGKKAESGVQKLTLELDLLDTETDAPFDISSHIQPGPK